jgi:diadenosine tetraphosphatase ApaH/serine/threonine PP2A family protein phosphatase
MSLDLDAILQYLEGGNHLDEQSIILLLGKFIEILYDQPNLLTLSTPLTVCGDIHGQLYDLFELFEKGGSPSTTQYLFQGDYVDRGLFSLETFLYLVTLKLKYPAQIWMLRGNHESRAVSKQYGLFDECLQNYGHAGIWNLCQDVFDLLPIAALINKRIFSVHGGLSPAVPLIEKIQLLDRQNELGTEGAIAELAWGDPNNDIGGWAVSSRGAGWHFGNVAVNEFCRNNRIDLITRAHELAIAGFQYACQEKVLTVWSAPNYGYVYQNVGSLLKLSDTLERNLVVFEARSGDKRKKPEDFVPHYFA